MISNISNFILLIIISNVFAYDLKLIVSSYILSDASPYGMDIEQDSTFKSYWQIQFQKSNEKIGRIMLSEKKAVKERRIDDKLVMQGTRH